MPAIIERMSMNFKVQIINLVDNAAPRPDMLVEHGLSMWIEYRDKRILWDTGQSGILLANAETLGINLAATDIIAISHGHYDHTGGLPAVIGIANNADIYFHPEAVSSRYSKKQSIRSVGMPLAAVQSLRTRSVRLIESWAQIDKGIFLTGLIPRKNTFEDTGGAFYLDAECLIPDSIPDDQAMVLESEKGLVVVLGCAHSGLVNTLDYICHKTGENRIYAIIGGMHLINANRQRLDCTAEAFRKYDVQKIIPLHCTGQLATDYLKELLADRIITFPGCPCLNV
jgi:7,8-dihydropterin-6-yl-methyl-4-(beta-D-ribofuranosyl)aminobenzene 5'-phosphate synthase